MVKKQFESVDWIHLTKGRIQRRAVVNTVMNHLITIWNWDNSYQ